MSKTAHDIQIRELHDEVRGLQENSRSLQSALSEKDTRLQQEQAKTAALEQQVKNLQEQIDYLKKMLFGKSSEKRAVDTPGQMNLSDFLDDVFLFNEAEATPMPSREQLAEEDEAKTQEKPKKRRPKTSFFSKLDGIPVHKKVLDLPEDQKKCPKCGTELVPFGKPVFVRREFNFIPARAEIVEIYSQNYQCPQCREFDIPTIVRGKDGSPRLLYGMASSQTVGWIMYQKYVNALPLYRQAADFQRNGIPLDRSTMANWVIKNSEAFFVPIYEYLHRELVKRHFAMADETPCQVLHEPGRRAQTKSYLWLFRSGEDGEPPLVLYKYSPTRNGDNAVDFLKGFTGYLMTDGFSGYNKVKGVKRCACWAHIRRYLIDAIPKGQKNDYALPAVQGYLYVEKLFAIEKEIKQKYEDNFDAIKEARLKREKPVIEAFLAWLDKQMPVKGSRFATAVTYIQNRRPYLQTYLEDGRCSLSNNWSENSVRPFTVGRKNFLFFDTPKGADASAAIYTIVELAKANGVNIYHYLTYLLDICPTTSTSDAEIEKLMPWNQEVKDEIARRVRKAMKTEA